MKFGSLPEKRGPRNILSVLVFLLIVSFSLAGEHTWSTHPIEATFQRLTAAQGLTQSTVFCILQDSRGLLWFGTENGLCLYDGNHLTVFHHQEGREDSIGSDWVMSLLEDSRGYLWVGTIGGGLSYINLHTMAIHSTLHDPAPVPGRDVSCLALDNEGNLWIGTQTTGLFMLPASNMPPAPAKFLDFPIDAKNPRAIPGAWVPCMLVDHKGVIWVASGNEALCRVVKGDGNGSYTFERFLNDPARPDSSPPPRMLSIVEDEFGVIWIGTFNGLYSCIPEKNLFRRYLPERNDEHALSAPFVMRLYRDRQGVLWAGTDGGGLDRMLPRKGPEDPPRFEVYKHQPMNLNSLGGNGVWSIYQDRTGILWVGTYQSGLSKLFLGQGAAWSKPAVHYSNKPLDPASLSGDLVNAILEDKDGNLWIGTYGAGLNRVIPPKRSSESLHFERFRANRTREGALKDDVITALYQDRQRRLWAGTYTGGLVRFQFPSAATSGAPQFVHYLARPGDSASLGSNFVTSILEDHKGRIWVTTVNGGLNQFFPETGRFRSYLREQNIGLSTNTLYSIAEDKYGTLWLGSHPGVNRFNPETGTAKAYLSGKDPGCLSHPMALAVHIDSKGTLWVGTNGGGLNKAEVPPWDGPSPKFIRYGVDHGLPSDVIRSIVEDGKGRLWLSTNRYICQFDTVREKGHPFPWRPELLDNKYIQNSVQLLRSGELAFGGAHGFSILNPDGLSQDFSLPSVIITDLKLSGKSVPVAAPFNGRILLNRAMPETNEIILTHKEYEFSLEFASLHFASPDKNQYAYMMEGLDQKWTFSGSRNFVTYTTLPPGVYRFRVKASNCDGIWNEDGASLRICVLPPWWMSWWFRGLLIALLGGVVYLIVWTRLKVLSARNRVLKETVDARTRELAEANDALRNQSLTDPLTGLRNRRFLYACMPEDVAQVQRIQRDVANNNERMSLNIDVLIILVDIDHFKDVNDRYGHHAGDLVLQQMSTILQAAVRGTDTVVRWGGEEFLIIARNTARADASILPERIRAAVEAHPFEIAAPEPIHCACSLGFSVFPFLPNEMSLFTWEQIVDIADACLYAAKRNGRNAWVGLVPDSSPLDAGIRSEIPKNITDLVKSPLFKLTTSLEAPLRWDD